MTPFRIGFICRLPIFLLFVSLVFSEDRPSRSIGTIAKLLFGDGNHLYDAMSTQIQLPLSSSTPVIGYRIPMPAHFFYPTDQALFPQPYFQAATFPAAATPTEFLQHPIIESPPHPATATSAATVLQIVQSNSTNGTKQKENKKVAAPPSTVTNSGEQNVIKFNYNLPPPPFYTNNYYPPAYPYDNQMVSHTVKLGGGHFNSYYKNLKTRLQNPAAPTTLKIYRNGAGRFKIVKNKIKKPTIKNPTTTSTSTTQASTIFIPSQQRPLLAESVAVNEQNYVPIPIPIAGGLSDQQQYYINFDHPAPPIRESVMGKVASMVKSFIANGMRFMRPNLNNNNMVLYTEAYSNRPILVQNLDGGRRRSFEI